MKRRQLGVFEVDGRSYDHGCLELRFGATKPDGSMISTDGRRSVASVAPSGEIVSLLIQDFWGAEGERRIPFAFGELLVRHEAGQVVVLLERR